MRAASREHAARENHPRSTDDGHMSSRVQTILLTAVAVIAFAGNSILCRAALLSDGGTSAIDPVSFTVIRIVAGVVVLWPLVLLGRKAQEERRANPREAVLPALSLLGYAFAFSLSYQTIPTGAGALLLFGCVQLTMLAFARISGEVIGLVRGTGAIIAFAGLCVLLAPSSSSLGEIDLEGAAFMAFAGICWGAYTLLGKRAELPVPATAWNFTLAVPVALLVFPLAERSMTTTGVLLAIASGALCSGVGYAIWYRALRGHTAVSASISQLTVPIVAAFVGAMLLSEELTLTFAVASVLVLAGVAIGLKSPSRATSDE